MPSLPVVGRELRAAARRRSTYILRGGMAVLALLTLAWALLIERASGGSPQLGRQLFYALTVAVMVSAWIGGLALASDSLSREKRDGTLGLLFLTRLRSWDVSLGKLSYSSLAGAYSLIGVFPIVALTLLLGGVAAGEYLRAIVLVGSLLAMTLAAGLAGSTAGRSGVGSGGSATALALAATFGPFLFGAVGPRLLEIAVGPGFDRWLKAIPEIWPSPAVAWNAIDDTTYYLAPAAYWRAVGALWLWTLAFTGWAVWWLDRHWRSMQTEPSSRSGRARFTFLGRARFLDTLANHPTALPALRRRPPWAITATVVGALAAVSGLVSLFWRNATGEQLYLGALAATPLWKLLLAVEASTQCVEDRASGAMELLLTTEITPEEYIQGRMSALRRQFGPGGALVAAAVIVSASFAFFTNGARLDSNELFASLFAIHIILLGFDGYTLAWLGVWNGISTRGGRSGIKTFLQVEGSAWLVTVGVVVPVGISDSIGDGSPLPWLVAILLGAPVALDLFWLNRARRGLRREFRARAGVGLRRSSAG